jgi:hypothetical protein
MPPIENIIISNIFKYFKYSYLKKKKPPCIAQKAELTHPVFKLGLSFWCWLCILHLHDHTGVTIYVAKIILCGQSVKLGKVSEVDTLDTLHSGLSFSHTTSTLLKDIS